MQILCKFPNPCLLPQTVIINSFKKRTTRVGCPNRETKARTSASVASSDKLVMRMVGNSSRFGIASPGPRFRNDGGTYRDPVDAAPSATTTIIKFIQKTKPDSLTCSRVEEITSKG